MLAIIILEDVTVLADRFFFIFFILVKEKKDNFTDVQSKYIYLLSKGGETVSTLALLPLDHEASEAVI